MFKKMKNAGDQSRGTKKSITTKNRLLETSLYLFQHQGYEKTTMREIAKETEISLGSAYYYFKSKEEIVLFFYQSSLERTLEYAETIFVKDTSLEEKLKEFFSAKFNELSPHRNFLKIIAGTAMDASASTSPFNTHNDPIRKRMIQLLDNAIAHERLKAGKEIKPMLGTLIWHLQMAVLFYWLHDQSENQTHTQKLVNKTLKLLFIFAKFSSMPLMQPINKLVIEICELLGVRHEMA